MLKRYLALAILAIFAAQNTKTMEQAILDGNFSYIQKNLKALDAEQKEFYLEVADKQLTLAANRSKGWIPNKWDAATLVAALGLMVTGNTDYNNFQALIKELVNCENLTDKMCDIVAFSKLPRVENQKTKLLTSNLQEDNEDKNINEQAYRDIFNILKNDFKNNIKYSSSLQSPIGHLKRSLIDLPRTNLAFQITISSVKLIAISWLLNRVYSSHYKNLDLKNRLAIKHLIENEKIIGQDSQEEKVNQETLKEKFNDIIDSTKKMGMNLKNNIQQLLNKIKTNLEQYKDIK